MFSQNISENVSENFSGLVFKICLSSLRKTNFKYKLGNVPKKRPKILNHTATSKFRSSIPIAKTSEVTPDKKEDNVAIFEPQPQSKQEQISRTSTEMMLKTGIEANPRDIPSLSKNEMHITPTQILKNQSPIPERLEEVRKRAKQVGKVLTSEKHKYS